MRAISSAWCARSVVPSENRTICRTMTRGVRMYMTIRIITTTTTAIASHPHHGIAHLHTSPDSLSVQGARAVRITSTRSRSVMSSRPRVLTVEHLNRQAKHPGNHQQVRVIRPVSYTHLRAHETVLDL